MQAYFETFNDSGGLQLSVHARPYTLRKSFRIAKSAMDTYYRAAFQSYQAKAYDISGMVNPIVAVRVENSSQYDSTGALLYSSCAKIKTQGSQKTLIVSGGYYSNSASQMTSVCQVYIFDTWSPPERADGAVLQLFTENGELIYDPAWKFLRSTTVTIPNTSAARYRMFEDTRLGTKFTDGTNGGFNYAVALISPKAERLNTGRMLNDGVWTWPGAFYISGCITETDDRSTAAHAGFTNGDYTKAMVIDTTGLPQYYG